MLRLTPSELETLRSQTMTSKIGTPRSAAPASPAAARPSHDSPNATHSPPTRDAVSGRRKSRLDRYLDRAGGLVGGGAEAIGDGGQREAMRDDRPRQVGSLAREDVLHDLE